MIWTLGLLLACGEKEADTSTDSPTPEPEVTETAPEPQPTSEPESSGEPETAPEPESQPTSEPESSGEPETAPEPESQPTSEPESGPAEGDVAAGEQVVQATCMGYCHGSNPAIENSGSMTEQELRDALANEVADLWFHSMVALTECDIDPQQVLDILAARFGVSGIEEKQNR